MTPEHLLRSMCERHGLPPDYGQRLLPLVRQAMEAPDEVRERLLALVDGNLATRAQNGEDGAVEPLARDADHDILMAVARVLHGWSPSQPLTDLGSSLGGLGASGSESA